MWKGRATVTEQIRKYKDVYSLFEFSITLKSKAGVLQRQRWIKTEKRSLTTE